MSNAIKITVCIACHNEMGKIQHAIASARRAPWCDELLIVDSGSTDGTAEYAQAHADRFEHRKWVDYTTSKKAMCALAQNDWVFLLDADEALSDALIDEISELTASDYAQTAGFVMPRKNYLLGRHARAWGPDHQQRLFHQNQVDWPHTCVHDKRVPCQKRGAPSPRFSKLKSALLHRPNVNDWGDYFDGARYNDRTQRMAEEMFNRGKRAHTTDLWFRPAFAFFKSFVLKAGFTQGTFGMLVARKTSAFVALKYTRLWHLQQLEQAAPQKPTATSSTTPSATFTTSRHPAPAMPSVLTTQGA